MSLDILSNFVAFESDPHTILGALEMVGVLGVILALFNKNFAPFYSYFVATSSKLPTGKIMAAIIALKDGELTKEEIEKIIEA
jgi:hypothetical protein